MQVTVRLFAALRELVGKGEITLETRATRLTVKTLLQKLGAQYGKEFIEYVYDENGDVHGFLQFLVNGKSIATTNGLKTKLKDGDTLIILPPVGGG